MLISRTVMCLNCASVRHIHGSIVRAKIDAVALGELVRDKPNLAGGGSKTVYLAGEVRERAECLLEATALQNDASRP
jgi:hypothetical protein